MAIHSSGAISFQDLINEFKVPKPVSLSQMYAGGGYVPEANAGVPKSGAISLGNFYGATAALVIDYNITADMFNFNTDTVLASYNWDGATPVILTVNIADGIVVSGNNTSIPAFIVNALPNGSLATINNSGYIIGMGGNGGYSGYTIAAGYAATAGGTALSLSSPTRINNLGTIGGGGGGGFAPTLWFGGGGGGGGRTGRQNSVGGSSNPGTFAAPGGAFNLGGGPIGAGGDWGAMGGDLEIYEESKDLYSSPGAGGAAVVGNSNVTWVSEGTIMGSRLN